MRIFLKIDELKFCQQNKIIDPHRVYLLESMDIHLSIINDVDICQLHSDCCFLVIDKNSTNQH